MVFGTFDGLHKGHLSYFKQARKYGDYLIAVVARNKKILEQKKHLPKYNESDRVQNIKKCDLVDKAILGNKRIYDVIEKYKPNIVCFGYDQKADVNFFKKEFSNIKIIRLKPYHPKKYKSSLLNQ